jgi:hypothetical protein
VSVLCTRGKGRPTFERIGQGRDRASAYVAEHPEIAEEVRRLLLEARQAENAPLGAPVTPPAVQAQAAA